MRCLAGDPRLWAHHNQVRIRFEQIPSAYNPADFFSRLIIELALSRGWQGVFELQVVQAGVNFRASS